MNCEENLNILSESEREKLIEKFGGMRLYVPKRIKSKSVFYGILSADSRAKFSKIFGGDYYLVPTKFRKLMKDEKKSRDLEMLKKREEGWTINELIQYFKLSRRRIFQILQELKNDTSILQAN